MAPFKRLLTLGGAALFVAGLGSVADTLLAQAGRQGSPIYDVKKEATIIGTVESVENISGTGGRGRHSMGGTHLVVKTEKEAVAVHVGPTTYLAEKGITLAKGDTVEILGSRVTVENQPVLIAREIKKGGKTWTLRDPSGRPLWAGGGR